MTVRLHDIGAGLSILAECRSTTGGAGFEVRGVFWVTVGDRK